MFVSEPLDDLCDRPLEVAVYEHAVVLTGPDGVALALTANAAERSAQALMAAAKLAKAAASYPGE